MGEEKEISNHEFSYAIVLGQYDTHIIPHPSKKQIKQELIPRLEEMINQLKDDS